MKVIERSKTPNGIEIQLEDWREHNTEKYPDLYGYTIGAYPISKHIGKYRWVEEREKFRLSISQSTYANYSNEDVLSDYEALKSGSKTLEDLANHFWNGKKDMWYLGMDVEYNDW